MSTTNPTSTLEAVQFLAGRCDYASKVDGVGFNKLDAKFGHSLAECSRLTDRQEFYALKMLRKYRRQLEGAGFDLDAMFTAYAQREQPTEQSAGERTIDVDGDVFVIRSPYDRGLVEATRRLPNRRWNAPSHPNCNTVPIDHPLEVEQFGTLNGFVFTDAARAVIEQQRAVAEAEKQQVEAVIAASKAEDSDIELAMQGLYPFQRAGAEYALDRRRTFIADEMGLGKTIQALAVLEEDDAFPALVIAPKTVVASWVKEIHKWLPNRSVQKVDTVSRAREGVDITVVHYDALMKRLEILNRNFKGLVLDESHFVKNYKAKRTQVVQYIADNLEGDDPLILLLSGTPLLNRPAELITQLQVMRRLDDFGGFKRFYRYFCGSDQRGAQNLNELNVELRASCMIRRLKKDVLPELPDRSFSDVPTSMSDVAEYRYAEAEFLRWYAEQGKDAMKARRAEVLVRLTSLRGLVARLKLEAGIEWCRDFLDTDGKLVCFAWSKDAQEAIFDALADYNPRRITAAMDPEERQRQADEFQTDDSVRAFVMPLERRVAVGITLTAASNVAFFELAWTPGDMLQAVDRCHRIGQDNAVVGWQLVAPDTIDDFMSEILEEKKRISEDTLDGTASADEEESMIDGVIGRMMSRRS